MRRVTQNIHSEDIWNLRSLSVPETTSLFDLPSPLLMRTSPNLFQQKTNRVALNSLRSSSLPAHPILNEMASGTIAPTATPAAQKGLQPLRRRRSDNKQLEKETSWARMHTDSQHMWLQPEPTFSFPIPYSCTAILLFFLAVPAYVGPECLSASDIQWEHEIFIFYFCSESSTHLEIYQILSFCGIYSFLSSPARDLSQPEGLWLKWQSFLSSLVLVLSSVCLMYLQPPK